MRFLHISDLHYLNDYQGKGGSYHNILSRMDDPFKQLKMIIDNCNKDFDFAIVSGDVCEYGEVEDYLSARKKLDDFLNCPVYVCSGNHDNKDNLIKAFEKKMTEGELFEVIDVKEARIIMLDSSHPEYNDGYISEKSCELLEKTLRENDVFPLFIVTHHHLLSDQFVMDKAIYPERLEKIVRDSSVTAILTGHTHHIYHGSFAGKQYHTTGSLSFVADSIEEGLCFYQEPSAVIFEYNTEQLSFRDIKVQDDRKVLECWSE